MECRQDKPLQLDSSAVSHVSAASRRNLISIALWTMPGEADPLYVPVIVDALLAGLSNCKAKDALKGAVGFFHSQQGRNEPRLYCAGQFCLRGSSHECRQDRGRGSMLLL